MTDNTKSILNITLALISHDPDKCTFNKTQSKLKATANNLIHFEYEYNGIDNLQLWLMEAPSTSIVE